jgi:uncharacterized membrane protein
MRSKARQRGASAVFVAISMVASIAALGMALDLGRLYYTHRDLQLLVDMAALDAARSAGGCLGKVQDRQGSAAGEAATSLQRNGASLAYLTAGSVEIGRQETQGGVRTFVPDETPRADSVRVTLRRPLPAKLVPMFSTGRGGTMTVTAAANMRPIVSFDVGSGLAGINSPVANNVLGGLLGTGNVGVGVLDVNGLASANVTLGDLSEAANAGTVQDFLDTQTTAPQLLSAIADALSGTSDAAVRTTLSALANGSDASHAVVPRQVLGVPAGGTADDAVVSVGSLVTAIAESDASNNLLKVTLPLKVPLLGDGEITVRLVELARPAIGPALTDSAGNPQTVANTAQGIITATFHPQVANGIKANIQVFAQVAAASGALADLACSQRGRPHSTVAITTETTAGRFGIGDLVDLRAPDPGPVMIVDLGGGFGVTAEMSVSLGDASEQRLTFDGPFPAPPQVVGNDPSEILQGAIDNAHLKLHLTGRAPTEAIQKIGDNLVASLEPILKDLVGQVARDVITPAADALGADLGTARVTVHSVSVDQPVIYAR